MQSRLIGSISPKNLRAPCVFCGEQTYAHQERIGRILL